MKYEILFGISFELFGNRVSILLGIWLLSNFEKLFLENKMKPGAASESNSRSPVLESSPHATTLFQSSVHTGAWTHFWWPFHAGDIISNLAKERWLQLGGSHHLPASPPQIHGEQCSESAVQDSYLLIQFPAASKLVFSLQTLSFIFPNSPSTWLRNRGPSWIYLLHWLKQTMWTTYNSKLLSSSLLPLMLFTLVTSMLVWLSLHLWVYRF